MAETETKHLTMEKCSSLSVLLPISKQAPRLTACGLV